jgi:hypothetical protein
VAPVLPPSVAVDKQHQYGEQWQNGVYHHTLELAKKAQPKCRRKRTQCWETASTTQCGDQNTATADVI